MSLFPIIKGRSAICLGAAFLANYNFGNPYFIQRASKLLPESSLEEYFRMSFIRGYNFKLKNIGISTVKGK